MIIIYHLPDGSETTRTVNEDTQIPRIGEQVNYANPTLSPNNYKGYVEMVTHNLDNHQIGVYLRGKRDFR